MTSIFLVLYVCAIVGVGIYVLTILSRFVQAHERIAGALERTAQNSRREGT